METLNTKRNGENSQAEKLNSKAYEPPIPLGFEIYEKNENGFFVINSKDESIFKWMNPDTLLCNGVDKKGNMTKSGRRDFSGREFPKEFDNEHFYETSDTQFMRCIKAFGGYYISIWKARREESNHVNFAGKGDVVDLITYEEAKKQAQRYAKIYAKYDNFSSNIPCGAAMDCVFEEIFERFEKEVMLLKKAGEKAYDVWNRHAEEMRKEFLMNGIYGMYDLIGKGIEMTSEGYMDIKSMVSHRCGQRGLGLISYHNNYKNLRDASFVLGDRNFKASDFKVYGCGYRLVLFPKVQK